MDSREIVAFAALDRMLTNPGEIVDCINSCIGIIDKGTGTASWGIPELTNTVTDWHGPREQLIGLVSQATVRSTNGKPDPRSGYAFPVIADADDIGIILGFDVGSPAIGRRMPAQWIHCQAKARGMDELRPDAPDIILRSMVQGWTPVFSNVTSPQLLEGERLLAMRRAAWKYPIGYRVWLRDDVATELSYLAEGLSRRDFAGGVLIAAPDEWSPEQIVTAFHDTYTRNGLDEVPHPVP